MIVLMMGNKLCLESCLMNKLVRQLGNDLVGGSPLPKNARKLSVISCEGMCSSDESR